MTWTQMPETERTAKRLEWAIALETLLTEQRKQSKGLKALEELDMLFQKEEISTKGLPARSVVGNGVRLFIEKNVSRATIIREDPPVSGGLLFSA